MSSNGKVNAMLAREKWQIGTIRALEMVFEERLRQFAKHGGAMAELADGTGPTVNWLRPVNSAVSATQIQEMFREDYVNHRNWENPDGQYGQLTRMHIIREEVAEVFELNGDDPEFIAEAIQVAALMVQWVEIKLEEQKS